MERRIIIVAILVIYLVASSLYFVGKPRIGRIRVSKTGVGLNIGFSKTGIGLDMGAYVLPPTAEDAQVVIGLMAPFRLEDADPREIMRKTEVTVHHVDDDPSPWNCEEGVIFWSGEGTRYVEFGIGNIAENGWFREISQDITAESFGATIWSGEKVWVEENIKIGETRGVTLGGRLLGIFLPGVYILGWAFALTTLYWPWILLLIGLAGLYWFLFLSFHPSTRTQGR